MASRHHFPIGQPHEPPHSLFGSLAGLPLTRRDFLNAGMALLGGGLLTRFLAELGVESPIERIATSKLGAAGPSAPNVLFIVIDTLRADHLSMHGYARPTDPTMKRLASEGVAFDNAYSASSWTGASHASLFTGRWPHQHGADAGLPLDDKFPTLAEVLTANGYRTGAFMGNFEILNRPMGFGRGFIHFEDSYQTLSNVLVSTVYGRLFEADVLHKLLGMKYKVDRRLASSIDQHALQWIAQDTRHPFFVFINYFDIHAPYIPPQPYRSMFSNVPNPGGIISTDWDMKHIYLPLAAEQVQAEMDAYDGGITYIDANIQSLLATLKAQGRLENTLVIITSDHGELFGEHGLFEHANSLYRPVIHVPLILWWPGHLPGGTRIDVPVSNASLAATILELIGSPGQAQFPIPSLVQTWADPANLGAWPDPISEIAQIPWAPPEHLTSFGSLGSAITPQFQYIEHSKLGDALYDLQKDPAEATNLVADPTMTTVLNSIKSYFKKLVSGL